MEQSRIIHALILSSRGSLDTANQPVTKNRISPLNNSVLRTIDYSYSKKLECGSKVLNEATLAPLSMVSLNEQPDRENLHCCKKKKKNNNSETLFTFLI